MSRWDIVEGVLIAWVIIKFVGPSAEPEIEGYRRWFTRHWGITLGLLAAYVIGWNLYRLLK